MSLKLTRVWNPAVGNKFSEENTKTPHVTLDTESAVVGGLGSSPFDWESKNKHHVVVLVVHCLSIFLPGSNSGLILVLLDEPGETKVCYLDNVVVANQDVPGGKVSVDVVLTLEVGHASSNLGRHVDQLG